MQSFFYGKPYFYQFIAGDFLFPPLGSHPSEGPGSMGFGGIVKVQPLPSSARG
jgi:hypothetical protein